MAARLKTNHISTYLYRHFFIVIFTQKIYESVGSLFGHILHVQNKRVRACVGSILGRSQ